MYQNLSMSYYWDKQSGMFVEILQEAVIQLGEYVTTTSMRPSDSRFLISIIACKESPGLKTSSSTKEIEISKTVDDSAKTP